MNESSVNTLIKIKQIQNNLKGISNQIKILGKSQIRNIQSLQKCFQQCVPLITSKIQQSHKHFKIKRMYQDTLQEKQNRILNIKLKKYDDMRKKTNVKALIFSIKHKQANQIRQQSIKHYQLMKQQKSKIIQEKFKKSSRIKSQQSIIKSKIKSFHQQKIQDLSKLKKKQQKDKEKRIQKSIQQIQNVSQLKQSQHIKFNQTHNSLKNLRLAMKKIKFMKPEEFTQVINSTLNNQTFCQDNNSINHNISFSNPKNNLTMLTECSEFQSPIYGAHSRFSPAEQLITTKLISKFLQRTQMEDKSFC